MGRTGCLSTSTLVPAILLVAAAVTAVSAGGPATPAYAGSGSGAGSSSSAGAGDSVDARVRAVMARMTLPEKIGQMFVSYVYGASATTQLPADVAANHALYGADVDNGAALLARYHPGGIIYFAWSGNLADPRQIATLSNGLQDAAIASGGVPLQISTDQEGGVVNRIGAPVAVSPGNMAIGATFDPAHARDAALVSGTELRAMGINVDDAPVVDVNTNPANSADGARSFGDRSPVVSAFAAAAVVAVGAPYDIAYLPAAPTYLAVYGYQPVSLAALTDTLLGASPTGRLPVTIRAPSGQVLFQYGSGIGYPG